MNGLVIRDPFVTWILEGKKIWEIRGSGTKIRGRIALIKGGSGHVVGTCDLVDVVGPLDLAALRKNGAKINREPREITDLYYANTYAWVLSAAKALPKPLPYEHKSGAVIWVKLSDALSKTLAR